MLHLHTTPDPADPATLRLCHTLPDPDHPITLHRVTSCRTPGSVRLLCVVFFVFLLFTAPLAALSTPRVPSDPGCAWHCLDSLAEGRLYRSDARFSSDQLHQYHHDHHEHHHEQHLGYGSDSEHLAACASSPPTLSQTDAEGADASDPHRTSFVKFAADDSDGADEDKETPFVRHNTPHPKDLKAKAQKHFKGKKIDGKVVHHDEADGLKEGEAFKPGAVHEADRPYRRTSPLPPLQLIEMPAHDADHLARQAAAQPAGHAFPVEQFEEASSPSPAPEQQHQRAVAFADHYEHGDIEEEDEDEEVVALFRV